VEKLERELKEVEGEKILVDSKVITLEEETTELKDRLDLRA